MPKLNLKKLSVSDLVSLRDEVVKALSAKIEVERNALNRQIEALSKLETASPLNGATHNAGNGKAHKRVVARARNVVNGKKVRAKYRGPAGDTWTGRGSAPRWLVALEAQGKKRESFLIDK